MNKRYILVCWPESQILMEQIWFDECILMNDENHLQEIGSSAFFVPENRYNELTANCNNMQNTMKYWMKFYDNNNSELLSISTLNFMGEDLNISDLKQRFNKDFIKNKEVKAVKISFLDVSNKINKSFIAGFKNNSVVIIDTDSKKEYSPKEFSEQLNILDKVLNKNELELNALELQY